MQCWGHSPGGIDGKKTLMPSGRERRPHSGRLARRAGSLVAVVCLARNVIPSVRPLVCCVQHAARGRDIPANLGCTSSLHATKPPNAPLGCTTTMAFQQWRQNRAVLPCNFVRLGLLPLVGERNGGCKAYRSRCAALPPCYQGRKVRRSKMQRLLRCRAVGTAGKR